MSHSVTKISATALVMFGLAMPAFAQQSTAPSSTVAPKLMEQQTRGGVPDQMSKQAGESMPKQEMKEKKEKKAEHKAKKKEMRMERKLDHNGK